ncbi:MAG: hypothetical protein HGA61_03695 [Candidatus Moranbacteria bacterium]|nr:hypothetical protein [Candidatus Moranbacteria bacterium]
MSAFQVGNNEKVKVDEKNCGMAVVLYALSYTFPTEERDTNFFSFLFRGEKAEGVIRMCLCFDDEICQGAIASAGKKNQDLFSLLNSGEEGVLVKIFS